MAMRGRAALAHLLAPFLHLGVELVVRHADVGEAHRDRLLAGIAAAQIPDLARLLLADDAGEKGGAVAGIDRAHLRADLAEDRLFRADGEVADGGQHVAAADGVALHAGDHRLRHVADGGVQFLHRQADRAAAVVIAVVRRLVAAGAEGPVAGAGQHDRADLLVVAGLVERLDQFVAGRAAEGVHLVGAIDDDPGDAVADLVDQVLELHGVLLDCRFDQPAIVRPPETLST